MKFKEMIYDTDIDAKSGIYSSTFINKYLNDENNDYDVESRALRRMKRLADITYIPVKRWLKEYIEFCKENSFWLKLWIFLWAVYFNFIAIVIEFIAFYLYFVVSFDFLSLYTMQKTVNPTPLTLLIHPVMWTLTMKSHALSTLATALFWL